MAQKTPLRHGKQSLGWAEKPAPSFETHEFWHCEDGYYHQPRRWEAICSIALTAAYAALEPKMPAMLVLSRK